MRTRELAALSRLLPLALLLALPAFAEEEAGEEAAPATLLEALRDGEVAVGLRYRYENVEQDAFTKSARASTLRTTLGWTSGDYRGFRLHLEAENVTEVAAEGLFANRGAGDLDNGVIDRPVVADPEVTEVNQAFLSWNRGDTDFSAGILEIVHGDQRFIGNVGWRQNHQSFDAVKLVGSPAERLEVTYAYFDSAHRIFGDDVPMASHFLNGDLTLPFGRLAVYGLLLDYDRPAQASLSTRTLGAELVGKRGLGGGELSFEVEAARQADAGDNPSEVDAGYLHLMAEVSRSALTVKAGIEVLEGSSRDGRFSTPLATLHKWNGWADLFLATPAAGLEDLYLELAVKSGRHAWQAVAHDFSAESSGTSYGTELDLAWTYRTQWGQTFGAKAALFDSDGFSSDTEKLWVWTAITF